VSAVPAIEAAGLGRDYGATRALDALDLVVPPGALVGLLGPNGAGKTTAMLLLATLLAPTRGTARIFGHDVTRARRVARERLGLVFQEPTVDPFLTVRENLEFAGRLAGVAPRELARAITAALERMGLAPRADQLARELSGGWRRLADIARATLHAPALLILDEPTVGLDPEHRARLWAFLDGERRARGTTVLFSTHYLDEAEPADRVLLMAAGRVVADGTPAAMLAPFGGAVLEVAGPGATAFAAALRDEGIARLVVATGGAVRIGLDGRREHALERAAAADGITRAVLRAPTLEDAYFARTGAGGDA
jgi:ABC-2 type transport system ATP-binding protein